MPTTKSCPQCSYESEVTAVACPECGASFFGNRFTARTETIHEPVRAAKSSGSISPIVGVIIGAVAVLVLGAVGYLAYPTLFAAKREAEVQTAIVNGDATKAGVSEKNKTAARAALNAIGELESVTSVGTNYQQYTSALQSAKIKFDAAIRDLEPIDQAEFAILSQLEESMFAFVDAREAWSDFIKDGDEFGFLVPAKGRVVSSLSSKYGYSPYPQNGEYYRGTVLQAIWGKASDKFRSAESQLK